MAIASLIGPDGWSCRVRIRTMAMPEESAPPPLAGGGRGEGKTAPRQVRLRRHHARYSCSPSSSPLPQGKGYYPALRPSGPDGSFLGAVVQCFLADGEHRTCLHVHVLHDAVAAGLVGEPDIKAAGRDARDAQPFVKIHGAVRIVAALIGTPVRGARRCHAEMRNGLARQVPEPGPAGVRRLRRAHSAKKHESHHDWPEEDFHGPPVTELFETDCCLIRRPEQRIAPVDPMRPLRNEASCGHDMPHARLEWRLRTTGSPCCSQCAVGCSRCRRGPMTMPGMRRRRARNTCSPAWPRMAVPPRRCNAAPAPST